MMGESELPVRHQLVDRVLSMTLNRPWAKNAVDWPMLEGLLEILAQVDDDVGAIVITGAGGAFCSGGDLRSDPRRGSGVGAAAARLRAVERLMLALHECDKPIISAVEGPAVGIGWSLALSADIVIAAESAYFASPFLARGLVPDGGLIWLLTRALGRHRAAHIVLDNQRITAPAGASLGIVSAVTADGQALETALRLAASLSAGPSDAVMLTKRLLRQSDVQPFTSFLEMEWLGAALNLCGPDAAEGRLAFAERRQPRFLHAATTQTESS